MNRVIFVLFIMIMGGSLKAQIKPFCHTPYNSPDILKYIPPKHLKTLSNNYYVVRIFLHIVRKSNGTGGLTSQEIKTALDILANDFAPHNICFYLLGIDEIYNDNFFNSLDPG